MNFLSNLKRVLQDTGRDLGILIQSQMCTTGRDELLTVALQIYVLALSYNNLCTRFTVQVLALPYNLLCINFTAKNINAHFAKV